MTNISPISTSSDSSATLTTQQSHEPFQKRFYRIYKDGFEGQSRVPIWHQELKETRLQVSKEWLRTSELSLDAVPTGADSF